MSPKKPYQKRLPSVLPPAPRRAPAQEAIRPRPAPPRARRSPPAAPSAAPAAPSPCRLRPSGSSGRRVRPSRPRVRRRTAPAAPPAAPPAEPAARPGPPPTGPGPGSGRQSRRTLALVAAALVGVVAGGVVAWQVVGPGQQSRTPTASLPIDGWPIAAESRAVTEVLPGGDLEVTHWIHAEDPIDELSLTLPELDGAEVSATRRGGDRRRARGVRSRDRRAERCDVHLRGRDPRSRCATGCQVRSSSARPRTAADSPPRRRSTSPRRRRATSGWCASQEVLSLACAAPEEQPRPVRDVGGRRPVAGGAHRHRRREPRARRRDRPVLSERLRRCRRGRARWPSGSAARGCSSAACAGCSGRGSARCGATGPGARRSACSSCRSRPS